jgi:hypothetical protein
MRTTMKQLLEVVFSVQSMLKLYEEHTVGTKGIGETVASQ